jgi:hypothetical protein
MSLDEVRGLREELERHLREKPLAVPDELVSMLRAAAVGAPLETEDGISLPPWRIGKIDLSKAIEVELTWTIDLGHESGVRSWFVARTRRTHSGWQVQAVSFTNSRSASGDSAPRRDRNA